jgi:cytochrome bd ubiquinol oxidase subunit II
MRADLNTLWFALIAVLWMGYFFLEGFDFDFGVGILLPFLGRDDVDRRVMVNAIGPVWDGNEVWLLVAGGATFAAFPGWYATLFSGFYLALFLILLALIVRGVAFELRGKHDDPRWRRWWDRAIFLGSLVPALLWGVALGDVLHGVPVGSGQRFVGSFLDLLQPYALLGGVMTLLLFSLHGAVFTALKTSGELAERARASAPPAGLAGRAGRARVPCVELRERGAGRQQGVVPGMVPITAIGLLLVVSWLLAERLDGWAFAATGAGILLVTATIFLNLYPRVLVSSLGARFDLTIYNTSSTPYTLRVMTVVALVFTPIVLVYQAWTYWVFRRRIGRADFERPAPGGPPAEPAGPADPAAGPAGGSAGSAKP